MLTGSAFRVSVPAMAATFRILTGRPKPYVKIADSGARRRHAFCPNCGTPVCASADADDPPTYSLRIGCLEQKAQLPPRRRIWCASALPGRRTSARSPASTGSERPCDSADARRGVRRHMPASMVAADS